MERSIIHVFGGKNTELEFKNLQNAFSNKHGPMNVIKVWIINFLQNDHCRPDTLNVYKSSHIKHVYFWLNLGARISHKIFITALLTLCQFNPTPKQLKGHLNKYNPLAVKLLLILGENPAKEYLLLFQSLCPDLYCNKRLFPLT